MRAEVTYNLLTATWWWTTRRGGVSSVYFRRLGFVLIVYNGFSSTTL